MGIAFAHVNVMSFTPAQAISMRSCTRFRCPILASAYSFAIFVALTLLSLMAWSPRALAQEGGSQNGGGGGTGIAVFDTAENASKARDARIHGQPLPKGLSEHIVTLTTTDYWEGGRSNMGMIYAKTGQTSDQYLKDILGQYLKPISPSFYSSVEDALSRVRLDDERIVDETGNLYPIEDTGPILGLDLNSSAFARYAIVQIAVRRFEMINGKLKPVVHLDKELYNKLGCTNKLILVPEFQIQNQAALKLHEAIYLLGYNLNQSNSARARRMTMTLLSNDFLILMHLNRYQNSEDIAKSPLPSNMIHYLYQMGFGEFPYINSETHTPRGMKLHEAYNKLEHDFTEVRNTAGRDDMTIYDKPWLDMMHGLSNAEAFIMSAEAALRDNKINDFYEVISDNSDDREVEVICENAAKEAAIRSGLRRELDLEKEVGQKVHEFCNTEWP